MPKRKQFLACNTYYHIYNRGLRKQTLFFSDSDFAYFFKTIQRYKGEFPNIRIHAYCFLPNHFHFLISEKRSPDSHESGLESQESQEISHFMRKVQQSYAMYFNKHNAEKAQKEFSMPVFQGRFKVREVVTENYLEQVKTYIEYNAVKHEIVEDVNDWKWSSYGQTSPDL